MFLRRATSGPILLICLFPAICQLGLGQNNPVASINLTRIETSIEQGKLDEVEKPLIDYAIAHPNDVRALELLSQVRYQQHRFEEALSLSERVLTLDPSFVRARINLGKLKYELGQREAARLLLTEVTTSRLDVKERLALTKALVLVGEFEKARVVAEYLPAAVKNSSALPLRAAIYLGLNQRQGLVGLMPSIKKASVTSPEVAAACGEVLVQAGMLQEALDTFRSALAHAPNNFRLLVLLGQTEVKTGNLAEARRLLNSAVKLKPQTVDSLFAFGLLESAEKNYNAAVFNLEQANALAPESTLILVDLIVNAMRANRPGVAVDAANKLLQLKPDDPESQYLFGAASLQNGSLRSAQTSLVRYRQQRPDDVRGCLALGITFARQRNQSEQAVDQFEQCLKIDPTNTEAKYQLGALFKSEGEVNKAIQMFEEVIARASQHASALRDLGALYLQTGSEAKARAVLEQAAALNPEDAETHFLLSRLYNLIGESSLAKQHLGLFQQIKSRREKPTSP